MGMWLNWITDCHLDRAAIAGRRWSLDSLQGVTAPLLSTGDLSNGKRLVADLQILADRVGGPLYYVLGNHDHYGSSIAAVRDAVIALAEHRPEIQWLPPHGVVRLDSETLLVGVDGWSDGRAGNPLVSRLRLNDDRLIAELSERSSALERLMVRRLLADADAKRLKVLLTRAAEQEPQRIIVATHIPPLVEAINPRSRAARPEWYPLLICVAVGRVLQRFASEHPEISLLVLSGHVHAPYEVQAAPNLLIRVGAPRTLQLITAW